MSLKVSPLRDDLPFGARVLGITREALADAQVRDELNQLFQDQGMIVFEEVEPSSALQVEISCVFGPLKDHPVKAVPRAGGESLLGVIEIATGPEASIVEIDGKQLVTWQPWHFDHSYNSELNRAGVLRSVKAAVSGGLTGFADGIQIYRDMDPAIRDKVEGLELLYTLNLRFSQQRYGRPKNSREVRPHDADFEAMAATLPRAIHPAVWTRESGEKVLHMSPYGSPGIYGNETAEGLALLEEAWAEIMRVMKPYYHQWKETDMVIWDNWRMLHEAGGCDPKEERVVHRTTIRGDYGLGRFEPERDPETVLEATA